MNVKLGIHVLAVWAVLAVAGVSSAHAEPPPIEAYGRSATVSDLSLSPSGQRAAFLISNTAGRRIAVQDINGKLIVTVDPGPSKLVWTKWAGNDHLLIATSATVNMGPEYNFKHELQKVQVLDLKTLKTLAVFDRTKTISNVVFGYYGATDKAGRWYGYFGGVTMAIGSDQQPRWIHGYTDLYQVDLDTGEARLAARGDDLGRDWVVGPDGEVIANVTYKRKDGIWRLHAGSGDAGHEAMTVNTPLNAIDLVGLGRTPGTVLVHDTSGEDDVYKEVSLADGKTQALFADESIEEILFDRNTKLLLGAQVRGANGAVLFDPAQQAKVRGAFKAFAGRRALLKAYDPGFDKMIVATDGGDDSGTFWFVDIAGHSAVPLGQARPDVASAQVGSTRMFAYKAGDGLALEGVLTLPPGRDPKALPLIVMPHGGPLGLRDDVGFDWWAQAFASRGYAVFQPNYRGSGGYGLAFELKGYGEWGRKMLSDVSDGVAALAAQGFVDPKRACIVGGSYGGYAALAGVTLQKGLYRCAVSVAGVADLPALRRYDLDRHGDVGNETVRYWRTAIQGDAKDEPGMAAISPTRHAAEADAPVLLVHGSDDTVVPIEQSRTMDGALRRAGKSVEFIEMKGQDHWLTDEATRLQMLKASVAFVEKYDPPN